MCESACRCGRSEGESNSSYTEAFNANYRAIGLLKRGFRVRTKPCVVTHDFTRVAKSRLRDQTSPARLSSIVTALRGQGWQKCDLLGVNIYICIYLIGVWKTQKWHMIVIAKQRKSKKRKTQEIEQKFVLYKPPFHQIYRPLWMTTHLSYQATQDDFEQILAFEETSNASDGHQFSQCQLSATKSTTSRTQQCRQRPRTGQLSGPPGH